MKNLQNSLVCLLFTLSFLYSSDEACGKSIESVVSKGENTIQEEKTLKKEDIEKNDFEEEEEDDDDDDDLEDNDI